MYHHNPEQNSANFATSQCVFGMVPDRSAVELHCGGHSWNPGKRLIWLCFDREEVEAQPVAIVPSQHGPSVFSEHSHHPPLHYGLLMCTPADQSHRHLFTYSCRCTQSSSPISPCTGTKVHLKHTLTLEQWVWHPVRHFLAVLQVVCLHERIMLCNGCKVAGVNHQLLLQSSQRNSHSKFFWHESHAFRYYGQASVFAFVCSLRNFVPSAVGKHRVCCHDSWCDRG